MRDKYCDIIAGIVLFNPDVQRLKAVIGSVFCQVKEIVLVDNGSDNISNIQSLAESFDNVSLIRNRENKGIAKALNQICAYGDEKGYKWCLTLDHDTVCHEKMVCKLMNYQDCEKVGIICPMVDYEGMDLKLKNTESETVDVYACMTSGSLTRLKAWREIGGFKNGYFIDFVDNEFCMRLRLIGYRIVRVNGCVMHHQLGETTKIKLFNLFPVTVTTHKPWRYYYMTRNNLLFIKQYRKHLNVTREFAKLTSILYHGVLYSVHRRETLVFIWRGINDAIRHREGQMS